MLFRFFLRRPEQITYQADTFNNVVMFLNTATEPCSNADFRRALAYAFPYEETVNEILNGNASQSVGLVPRGLWGHSDDVFQYTCDLDKAKEYLDKSGVDTELDSIIDEAIAATVTDRETAEWTTKRGLEVFGPRSFGYDMDFCSYF